MRIVPTTVTRVSLGDGVTNEIARGAQHVSDRDTTTTFSPVSRSDAIIDENNNRIRQSENTDHREPAAASRLDSTSRVSDPILSYPILAVRVRCVAAPLSIVVV
jgi:hypothetical protein